MISATYVSGLASHSAAEALRTRPFFPGGGVPGTLRGLVIVVLTPPPPLRSGVGLSQTCHMMSGPSRSAARS
ncbi:hypothetical protein GCM10027610_139620 [Dactylosporangium cerinum]